MKRSCVALVALLLPAFVNGQSLGEAAAREKERRQKNGESGVKPRVVNEEDLESGSGELANDPDQETMYQHAPERPALSGLGKQPKPDGGVSRESDETSWRDRKARAVTRVETARKKHQMYSEMWLAPVGERYVNRKTGKAIETVGDLQKLTAAAKAELDAAEKALQELEEKARRANVPPGWLR